jgi:YVTN family beta-propeller protein
MGDRAVITTLAVGNGPGGIAAAGMKVYVTNYKDSTVSVIDTTSDNIVDTVTVGSNPQGVAITPDGKKAYVPFGQNSVSIIDTATDKVLVNVTVGHNPYGIAVSPDGTKVYVTNSGDNTISVIDTGTNYVDTEAVGSKPCGAAFTPGGTKAYVANFGGNTVSVIDTTSDNVVDTVIVESSPISLGKFIGSQTVFKKDVNPEPTDYSNKENYSSEVHHVDDKKQSETIEYVLQRKYPISAAIFVIVAAAIILNIFGLKP